MTIEHRKSQDAALQQAYTLCTEYEYLRMALEYTPVFGVVDYSVGSSFTMRDVVMIRKHSDDWYQAGARGISYCEEDNWDAFVKQAKACNLAFVIPSHLHRVSKEDK